jgi:hypothetical protein
MQIKLSLIIILIFGLFSCREIKEVQTPLDNELSLLAYQKTLSPFVKDDSFDFFLANTWYTYDEGNHIIWPNFKVFALRKNNQYYKFQVIDYYNLKSEPGNFTIRVEKVGERLQEFKFEAKACGNTFTNPNYDTCVLDPQKNIYTYVNIDSGKNWIMTDFEAELRDDWDIAFRGTEIKLNSGDNGPSNVRISLLYFYGAYYLNNAINYQMLAEESFGEKGLKFFNLDFPMNYAPFALPAGQDRVIFEDDWFIKRGRGFRANSQNWWILKSSDGEDIHRFNVKEIADVKTDSGIQTTITLDLFESEWVLPVFSSSERLIKRCFDLKDKQVVECSDSKADLIFSARNRGSRRSWRWNVVNSGVGPLSYDEMREF